MQEVREEVSRLSNRNFAQQELVNRSVQRIALQPVQRPRIRRATGAAFGAHEEAPTTVTLSRNPRTLFVLWQEYQFGIGGCKAAREFSSAERGEVKHKYHRRKVVWDKIDAMIRGGYTSNAAIDELYIRYGLGTPVTRIINLMLRERRG